jgi:hypothetical protein
MVFNSLTFAVFFAAVLVLYFRLPHRGQNLLLLIASYVFYGAWDWRFCSLLLASTSVDWWVGLHLDPERPQAYRRRVLFLSCVFNLGLHAESAGAWLKRSDADIFDAVAREWTRLFPRYNDALRGLHVQRWRYAMPVYSPAHVARVKELWKNAQGQGHLYLCGDYLNHPWVEGSIRCGEKVARRICSAPANPS